MSVKAMFVCNSKQSDQWGTALSFTATQGQSGKESKDFAEDTPSGNLNMNIAAGRPAADFFEQGKSYYLTFEEAPGK